jgi:hypothetical protein
MELPGAALRFNLFLVQINIKMYKSVDTVEEVTEAVPSRRAGMLGGRTETSGLYRTQTPQPAHTVYSCLLLAQCSVAVW